MLEKDIEAKLRKYALSLGYMFVKFVSPGTRGVPDRLAISPGGFIFFMELKRTGVTSLTRLQAECHATLRKHGVLVYTVNSIEQGKAILDEHCLS